jgi:putative membrane protein
MRLTVYVLGVVTVLAPGAAMAQVPATSGATQTTGSAQNPQNPSAPAVASANASPFATDLSASGAGGTDAQLMRDKIFVRKATDRLYAEQQFGQLAVQKASNEEVKKFGERLVKDHPMLDTGLQPAQDKMGIHTPAKLGKGGQAEYDKLNGLSGADFDKEFLIVMVKNHVKELDEFKAEEESTNDPALKDVASKGERVVYYHLRYANKLAAANGVPPAPMPTEPQP